MKTKKVFKIIIAGLIAGIVSEGILGALFMSPPVQKVLYNPEWQSQLFIDITPTRNMFVSVAGLVVLSVIHSVLYVVFRSSVPGNTWIRKGLFWGLTIWLMFWVFQEWFIYHTLLKEPVLLNLLELSLLLIGSLVEGIIIAGLLKSEKQ